jgi:hypothetical protein
MIEFIGVSRESGDGKIVRAGTDISLFIARGERVAVTRP